MVTAIACVLFKRTAMLIPVLIGMTLVVFRSSALFPATPPRLFSARGRQRKRCSS
ncbi:hypothetical protein PO124_28745 [Bacillus licheniformis]|nr:hypothetical protein [Bacillus licheniformis]